MIRFLAALVLVWALGFGLFVVVLPGAASEERTDAIVVLTGGPSRIPRALDLLERGRARRLLVSGVGRAVKPHELALQNRVPTDLFACCVDLGREAVDTRSNAEETARWLRRLRYRSVRLVTTDWHMPRARFELAHALSLDGGPALSILPDGVHSEPALRQLLTEYNKYLLRRLAVPLGI
jgi:uncharacterized SAM-binding protein YcdF (DUF218 family)